MIIRANSFGITSRFFPVKNDVDPIDDIELLPIGADSPLPECKLSKQLARQHCERAREKFVAAKETEAPVATSTCLSQQQTLNVLKKISALLAPAVSDPELDRILQHLISQLDQYGDKPIPLELWHSMERSLAGIDLHNPALQFIQTNIDNLRQVCRHAWLSQSHAALVQIFASEIEQQVVANPSLADVETTRLSLDVSLPVPLLSAGGEINYLHSKTIDDEGNYVSTTAVSGGFTCKISALLASARGKALASGGRYIYFRTATDHARHFFKPLLEKNSQAPSLARYLSTGPDNRIEALSNFEDLQHTYLEQQARYSQAFSVLLGLTVPGSTPDGSTSTQAAAVHLQAPAPKHIRGTKGTVTSLALAAEGYAGILMAQVGVNARGKNETKCTQRVLTLCELIDHRLTDAATKAGICRQIVRASTAIRKKACQFWTRQSGANPQPSLKRHIACLSEDWQAYERMHAAHAAGHATTGAVLEAFHSKYGAGNTKDCLRRMALLVASMYIELREQAPGAEQEQLKSDLLALEQAMHHSSIPNARKFLAQHALARQRIDYVNEEKMVQFTVGEPPPMGGTAPGVKIISRTAHHYNPWRAGEYVTVELAMGNNLGANQKALKAVADYFNVGPTGLGRFFGSGTYVRCGLHTIRFFRPSVFPGLPFSKQYERRTEQSGVQAGATVPIPLGVVTLQASIAHARTSSRFVSETPGSDSMLYFATHYMHALSCGKTTMTGEKIQHSYWYRIEQEQQVALEKLFLNYARDAAKGQGSLLQELDVVEATLADSPARLQQLRASSSAFLAAAMQLERERSAENYQTALDEFKQLLRSYYPDWQRNKESSKAYKTWQLRLS